MQRKWWVLLACGLIIFLVNIDMTIVNVGLPSIAKDFAISLEQVQGIITTYLFAAGLFFIIFGKLADELGKKRVYLLGVSLFLLASLCLGLTSHFNVLLGARFIQGMGFAGTLGLSMALIAAAFPLQQKGLATGLAITLTGLGQITGPLAGGLILKFANWHWLFLINLPIGILSFILTLLFVQKDGPIKPIQWRNFLINPKIFTYKNYLKIVFVRFIYMFFMFSSLMIFPLYLQNILGFSPMKTGLTLLIMTLMVAIFSPLTGLVLDRHGFKMPLMGGLFAAIISLVALLFCGPTLSWAILGLSLFAFGIGTGLHIPSSVNGVMAEMESSLIGTAIGCFFTLAMLGGMLGTFVASLSLSFLSKHYLFQAMTLNNLHPSATMLDMLIKSANGSQYIPEPYSSIVHLSFTKALHGFVLAELVLIIIACFVCTSITYTKR